jgi:hypothetical protein
VLLGINRKQKLKFARENGHVLSWLQLKAAVALNISAVAVLSAVGWCLPARTRQW